MTDLLRSRVSWGSRALRLGAKGVQQGPCKGEGLSQWDSARFSHASDRCMGVLFFTEDDVLLFT